MIQGYSARWPRLLLIGITLFGLAERLHIAHFVNGQVPNSAERLVGDSRGYDTLAYGLLHGEGFNWPNRVPFYPAFLALEHWAVTRLRPDPVHRGGGRHRGSARHLPARAAGGRDRPRG